ncbi:dynein axonemal intermediate chain 7 [Salmo trutta]|uniref:dynein axonemal intermediate chain 7 n=1 Tax=Salmo trutta TaxID=8032 RepID=UPI00113152BB|nr:protein CASC1-like [Salmo trutta]
MPSKDAKSAQKKGGKLSKAEKEQLQKEEDERRQKEEEEARLLAEKEEQERLERERKEQEEHQRLELKDKDRREDELNELRHLLEENQTAVTKWETDSRAKAKWDRYMRCDGSPDPSVQQEINTFINLWWEDPEVQIKPVLKECALALRLLEELEGMLRDQPEPADALRYQETQLSIQTLIQSKLDHSTEEILKSANAHSDIETGNMQTVVQDDIITLCLWANLNKNPRFKGFQFEEVGLGFELPKQLAISDVAVRILHTNYDHLSHLANLKSQNPSRMSLGLGAREEPLLEGATPVGECGETEGDGDRRGSTQQGGADEEVQSVRGSEGRKSAVSVISMKEERRSGQKQLEDAKQKLEENGSQIDTMLEGDDSGEGDSTPTPMDPVINSYEGQVVDLQQYTPLGGVFYCDVFRLPPQSQQLNGWEMRELLDTGLQPFPYPTEQTQIQGSASMKLEDSGVLTCPPVGVTVTLPDSVLFLEDPQVARWDPEGQHWKTDCISETSYDQAERKISFKMDSFYAFTLLQDSYANMPFQSWELRPLGQDSALLTITAALTEVSITIKGSKCMLQSDQERGLNHILGQWMSPSQLQKAMVSAGVNIFVNQYSDKYVSVNTKDPLLEHTVYEQMALLSSAFAFSWSQWNTQCGHEHLVLQVCEHLDPVPVREDSWCVYLLGARRSQRLRIKEHSEAFSPELDPGSEFHSTFLHMLRDGMSPAGQERRSHHLFVEAVHRLLRATRPLTYS